MQNERNWGGNYWYEAARLHCPETLAQVQELAAGSRKIKAIGTRHSFNSIADTSEDLVSLTHLNKVVSLDAARRTVTVEAGIRYGDLAQYLHREGWALHNLASLPHISVGGAVATATHGSGMGNRSLSSIVSAMELVTSDGALKTFSRERDGGVFAGVVVGLGALGIVTRLTLDIVPAFTVRQDVYENLSLDTAAEHFDAIMGSAYSVSLFTDWRGANFTQAWRKSRIQPPASNGEPNASRRSENAVGAPQNDTRIKADTFEAGEAGTGAVAAFYGATYATRQLHPIVGVAVEHCTEQGGVAGAWHERLPHFRLEYTPCSGEELQSEYFVPRSLSPAALRALYAMREQIAPLLLISEIRAVAADALWLSPYYQEDCAALQFTWQRNEPAVTALLPRLEAALAPFHARPHWGKLFAMRAAQIGPLYPRLPDFVSLCHELDPDGKFRNAYLNAVVFGAG